MRVAALVALALAACNSLGEHSETTSAPASPSKGPLSFETNAPQRLDRFSPLPMSSAQAYRETVARLNDRVVPIRVEPADLREPALYGFNVILDGRNHSVIVDGDEQVGYRLFVDLDGDGDLREEVPRHFVADNGPPTVVLELFSRPGGRAEMSAVVVFEIRAARGEAPFSVWKSDQTVRRGTAKLDDGEYAFALLGDSGVYGRDYQSVIFDIDGNGELDLSEDPLSPERYTLRDRVDALPTYVVIDPRRTIVARANTWSSVRALLDERLPKHPRRCTSSC